MKRKLFATLIAVLTVITCAFGFAACGGGNGDDPEPTALEKAYSAFKVTPNMKITVADNRNVKNVKNLTAFVEVDSLHNAVHYVYDVFESYVEVDYENGNVNTVNYNLVSKDEELWNRFNDTRPADYNGENAEIYNLVQAVPPYLPAHGCADMCIFENENDETAWASLDLLAKKFTGNGDELTSNLFIGLNDNGEYKRYACTVTITLDGEGRFESVVMDFGSNGKVISTYAYGTANIIIPEAAKNASLSN